MAINDGFMEEHESVYGDALDNMVDCGYEFIMIRSLLLNVFRNLAEIQFSIIYDGSE